MGTCYREANYYLVFDLKDLLRDDNRIRKGRPEGAVLTLDTFDAWTDSVISVQHDPRRIEVEVDFALVWVRECGKRLLHDLFFSALFLIQEGLASRHKREEADSVLDDTSTLTPCTAGTESWRAALVGTVPAR